MKARLILFPNGNCTVSTGKETKFFGSFSDMAAWSREHEECVIGESDILTLE